MDMELVLLDTTRIKIYKNVFRHGAISIIWSLK